MNIFDEEREKITECNITFCKECCDKWNYAKNQCYFKESYKKLPRKPRPLAAGMNWQNKFKNHFTNLNIVSII